MSAPGSARGPASDAWSSVRERLHARGLRWTPQRRALIEVLARTDGHVTGAELVERCRELDPATIPSTVYRTLDVLEEIGLLSHSHAADGREEFHVLPDVEHGHLTCLRCLATWEIPEREAAELVAPLERRRGFAVDLSHLSVSGLCAACRSRDAAAAGLVADARGTTRSLRQGLTEARSAGPASRGRGGRVRPG